MTSPPVWSIVAATIVASALAAGSAAAGGESGLQTTRDDAKVLINKDIGGERWAITYSYLDGSVTGNVFLLDGGAPRFVDCSPIAATADEVTFSCFGASSCRESPCGGSAWQLFSEVSLPRSFFYPRDVVLPPPPTCPRFDGTWLMAMFLSCATSPGHRPLVNRGYLKVTFLQDGCKLQPQAPDRLVIDLGGYGGQVTVSALAPLNDLRGAPCSGSGSGTALATPAGISATFTGDFDCCARARGGIILQRTPAGSS